MLWLTLFFDHAVEPSRVDPSDTSQIDSKDLPFKARSRTTNNVIVGEAEDTFMFFDHAG